MKEYEEPHKTKYIDSIYFKKAYWSYLLDKELNRINIDDEQWNDIEETYDMMSRGYYTPATPSRFNLGTRRPQGSSCFLIAMEDDSLSGIYNTLKKQALISKYSGGVGIWSHNIRSTGSYIEGTNGKSNGIMPMLRVFDASSVYVDQGGGKRPGKIAMYLEIWHADFFNFIELKRRQGDDLQRTKSLFYGFWICDEFWRCLKTNQDWYLFDPAMVPKLYDSYDESFSTKYLSDEEINSRKAEFRFTYLYRKYVRQEKYEQKVKPKKIISEIVKTVRETGVPYMLSKDASNRKSNQKNLGVIKSSNLCTEIIEYSDKDETAVCNLHSIALPKFLREWTEKDSPDFKYQVTLDYLLGQGGSERYLTFDFEMFNRVIIRIVKNLDRIIDLNFYPTPCTERSNLRHRPMGIGIQGEADMISLLRLPWGSKESNKLRFHIFEHLYYTCLKTSNQLAKVKGTYSSFEGSPASQGILQYDLWLKEGHKMPFPLILHKKWEILKKNIKEDGLRNSLFIAPMPTSSSAGILGNSPCFEPHRKLVYKRQVGAGEITLINKYFVNDMCKCGLWDIKMSDQIIENNGSIQSIMEIPLQIKSIYPTAYEVGSKKIVDAAYYRGWFVDQSQSLNFFMTDPSHAELTATWTRGWRKGLKTLSYYINSRSAVDAQKMQINLSQKDENVDNKTKEGICVLGEDCVSCGS